MKTWADRWKLAFEPTKCKAMTITRTRQPTRTDLFFWTTKSSEVEELEILGVTVDKKLTWNKHIKQHFIQSWSKTWGPQNDLIQTWCLRESNSLQGPDTKCHGMRLSVLDEYFSHSTPTSWSNPGQSPPYHRCGRSTGPQQIQHSFSSP